MTKNEKFGKRFPGQLMAQTPRARAAFVNVFSPRSKGMGAGKYEVTLIFEKDDVSLEVLEELARDAAREKFGSNYKKATMPFKNGADNTYVDDNGDEHCRDGFGPGTVYVRAWGQRQPTIAQRLEDGSSVELFEADELYSGCYVDAMITAFAYDYEGRKGVSFGLRGIRKLANGDRLGGQVAVTPETWDSTDEDY